MNVDFHRLRAVDVLFVLQSFLPPSGSVKKVTVYPSNFGLERMALESKHGPQRAVAPAAAAADASDASKDDAGASGSGASGSGDSGDSGSDDDGDGDEGNLLGEGFDDGKTALRDEGGGFSKERLRKYELDKLKYWYAVVECDSVRTAATLYGECDGMEYEGSSNVFDLRFVPEGTSFDNPPRDTASRVPEDYTPPNFTTQALQSSHVELTWEDDEPVRGLQLLADVLVSPASVKHVCACVRLFDGAAFSPSHDPGPGHPPQLAARGTRRVEP